MVFSLSLMSPSMYTVACIESSNAINDNKLQNLRIKLKMKNFEGHSNV